MSQPTLPTVRRYLSALSTMTQSPDPEARAWARGCLRDLGEAGVGVADYLGPLMTLPAQQLTPLERRARALAS